MCAIARSEKSEQDAKKRLARSSRNAGIFLMQRGCPAFFNSLLSHSLQDSGEQSLVALQNGNDALKRPALFLGLGKHEPPHGAEMAAFRKQRAEPLPIGKKLVFECRSRNLGQDQRLFPQKRDHGPGFVERGPDGFPGLGTELPHGLDRQVDRLAVEKLTIEDTLQSNPDFAVANGLAWKRLQGHEAVVVKTSCATPAVRNQVASTPSIPPIARSPGDSPRIPPRPAG